MRDKYKKTTKKRKKIPKKITCNKKHKKKIDRNHKETKRRARGLISRLRLNTRRAKIFPTNNRSMRNSSPTRRSRIKKSDTIMKDMRDKIKIIRSLHLPRDTQDMVIDYYKANLDTNASTIQRKFKTGKIGLQEISPTARLHIKSDSSEQSIFVESDTKADAFRLHRTNGANININFTNTDDTTGYFMGMSSGEKFAIGKKYSPRYFTRIGLSFAISSARSDIEKQILNIIKDQ